MIQVKRYLDLVAAAGPLLHAPHKPARAHLFKLLYPGLLKHVDLRDALCQTSDLAAMRHATEELAARGWERELHAKGADAWLTGSWCARVLRREPRSGRTGIVHLPAAPGLLPCTRSLVYFASGLPAVPKPRTQRSW